ncbi:MAG TPA: M28 family peptidase [Vicinamibacterales bacterium]|nr:M28 family peptidase [Vicinamibacterales bacterium]
MLRKHVAALALEIGERNLWRYRELQLAAEYIEAEFRRCGYVPARHAYEISRLPVCNIEVTLPARPADGSHDASAADEIIVLGAHYDTVGGSPGANDNGTGVAAMLHLARRFAGRPQRRTIRFVAFVNEEPPFFQTPQMGSVVYANAARARGDRIVGMLSLETMGYFSDAPGSQQYPVEEMTGLYPDVGNFIGFVGNEESKELLETAARAFAAHASVPLQAAAMPAGLPGAGWSDHWAFWQAGYPGLMVTDTAPWRYPWYHTADDTPDKIDFDKLTDVVNGLEHVTLALSS